MNTADVGDNILLEVWRDYPQSKGVDILTMLRSAIDECDYRRPWNFKSWIERYCIERLLMQGLGLPAGTKLPAYQLRTMLMTWHNTTSRRVMHTVLGQVNESRWQVEQLR